MSIYVQNPPDLHSVRLYKFIMQTDLILNVRYALSSDFTLTKASEYEYNVNYILYCRLVIDYFFK